VAAQCRGCGPPSQVIARSHVIQPQSHCGHGTALHTLSQHSCTAGGTVNRRSVCSQTSAWQAGNRGVPFVLMYCIVHAVWHRSIQLLWATVMTGVAAAYGALVPAERLDAIAGCHSVNYRLACDKPVCHDQCCGCVGALMPAEKLNALAGCGQVAWLLRLVPL
jgi:hypothetical protein